MTKYPYLGVRSSNGNSLEDCLIYIILKLLSFVCVFFMSFPRGVIWFVYTL